MVGLFNWKSRKSSTPSASVEQLPVIPDAPRMSAHLEARGVCKGFGQGETRTLAVQGVSLPLHRGELALLMGPSGSGKSTLLAMISGLLRPDSGRVIALGQDIWDRSQVELERFRLKNCSYIFQ